MPQREGTRPSDWHHPFAGPVSGYCYDCMRESVGVLGEGCPRCGSVHWSPDGVENSTPGLVLKVEFRNDSRRLEDFE